MKYLLLTFSLVLAGCATKPIEYSDLGSATKLVVGSGDSRWQMKGAELNAYLGTFETEEPRLSFVHNTQKGKIKINGRTYPLEYAEEKCATRPAIIGIDAGDRVLRIKQNKAFFIGQVPLSPFAMPLITDELAPNSTQGGFTDQKTGRVLVLLYPNGMTQPKRGVTFMVTGKTKYAQNPKPKNGRQVCMRYNLQISIVGSWKPVGEHE